MLKEGLGRCGNFLPKSSKDALKSSIFSMIIAFISAMFCYFIFRNGIQPYHDIVAGNITFPGMYKNVDFYTYFTFVFVYVIVFFLINRIINNKRTNEDYKQRKLTFKHYMISIVPAFVFMALKMGKFPVFYLCFYLFLVIVSIFLYQSKMENENIVKLVCSLFFIYLSLAASLATIAYYFPNIADNGTQLFIPVLWLLLSLACFFIYLISSDKFKGNKSIVIDSVSAITQVMIPLNLLSLINTQYIYKGNSYIPPQYGRFKQIVFFTIVIFILINIVIIANSIIKRKRTNSVFLTTLISFVSVCFWDTQYNLLINTDQFHTGETAVVYQQIFHIGQKWGDEFVSVLQGLGFILSAINEFVFGGTYATYVQTQNLFLVLCVVLIVVLLYPIVEHKWLILLIAPVMPLFYMNRIFLVVPVFLILLNPKIIGNPFRWTYCYILTCIIHVWYQPTYGGAVAASLLPILLFMWYRELKHNDAYRLKDVRTYTKLGIFLLSILGIGILCIPMLLDVIHFLRANGYETTIANGISIGQTLEQSPTYFTGYTLVDEIIQFFLKFGSGLAAVIIMIYMLLLYVIRQENYVKMIQGLILTLSAGLSLFLMIPAILTRIDPGISRIGGISVIYFGFLIPLLMYLYRKEIAIKWLALLICGVCLCVGFYVTFPPYLQIHEKANSTVNVPEDAIYVKPEETGLQNLGYAFIQNEQYLHEAMVINEVCNYVLNDNQTYYDFTDKSIYYLLTNRKVPGLYASSLVAANENIQNECINVLKENDVAVIFINQPLRYIGVNESLRAYRIYRYFMNQNYEFISYKGCNFLIRNDIDILPIQKGIDLVDKEKNSTDNRLDDLFHQPDLMQLPYQWGHSFKIMQDRFSSRSIPQISQELLKVGDEPNMVYLKMEQEVSGNKGEFLRIKLKFNDNKSHNAILNVKGIDKNGNALFEEFRFMALSDNLLIPIGSSPNCLQADKIERFELSFDSDTSPYEVKVEEAELYELVK